MRYILQLSSMFVAIRNAGKALQECCRRKKGVEKWEKKLYNKSAGTVEVVTHRRRADSEVQLQIGHLAFLARTFCCCVYYIAYFDKVQVFFWKRLWFLWRANATFDVVA